VDIIPPRLKEPVYRLYEMRLRQGLASSKSELPRHIAVLCDGNRRWARDAGHEDVSYGYRMGAHKIAEMLRWCQETGIEMATVYLLSTENLQRDPGELASLIEIITDVVEEICAPANRWSVRTVGDLELIGEEPARRLREAVLSTEAVAGSFHVNLAVGYGGRQEIVGAVRGLLGKALADGATGDQLIEAVTIDISTSPAAPLFGGGIANIAFLIGESPTLASDRGQNAHAVLMKATYWIETVIYQVNVPAMSAGDAPLVLSPVQTDPPVLLVPRFLVSIPFVDGKKFAGATISMSTTQIQYSQEVILNFDELSWPHVSVATLVPAQPIPVPAALLPLT